jgi:predicted nuclease with TOPRIM domain
MPIDTLKASKRLKALGFTEEQAEGVAELLNETDAASATKDDLYALEGRLDERFERIDERFERIDDRFEQIDSRFKQVDDRFDTLQADINECFELQSTRIDERFNAQHAEFKNYVTSRVAWAAGLLALYITLANYLMG